MTGEPTRYYLRFSQTADQNKLLKFYDSHTHADVLKRDQEILKKRINAGDVVLAENAAGEIVAACIIYPYAVTDAQGNEDVKWRELGTLRCMLNGYGLADALMSLHTLRIVLVDPPSDRFILQTEPAPVKNMVESIGFREFTPLQEVFNLKAGMVPGYNDPHGHENWYQGGIEAMPVMAAAIVKLFDNPVIENPRTHEKIIIDFSRSTFCRMLMPEIRALAAANLGDVDKPDLSKGIQKQQKKLINNFFR